MIVRHGELYDELFKMLGTLTPQQVEEGRKELLQWADQQEAKRRKKAQSLAKPVDQREEKDR